MGKKKRGRNKHMSKIIRMTPDIETQCRADFEKALAGAKIADGKFTFSKTFTGTQRKAVVHYTAEAWDKQLRVLKDFDKEVAWHGVAYRDEDPNKDDYYITDIMVYPQTVTGSTVEMDTEEYARWLMDNIEDERFDNIHMQAHSHVHMGTTPSSVDLTHQEEILHMLGDDDFYIFMIWNKSLAKTNKIYDLRKNVLFETADITVSVEGQDRLDGFIKEAKAMVKDKVYHYTPSQATTPGTTVIRQPGSTYQPESKPYNPVAGFTPGSTTIVGVKPAAEKKEEKKQEKARVRLGSGHYDYGDDDYDEDALLRAMYGEDYNSPYFYSTK